MGFGGFLKASGKEGSKAHRQFAHFQDEYGYLSCKRW